jgi:hypothetical protein
MRQNGKRRPALFHAYWTDPADGRRIGRASLLELREANRLYWKLRRVRQRTV